MTGSMSAHVALDLVVARVNGDVRMHLAVERDELSLCGRARRLRPPHKSFREAGCPDCLSVARDAGHVAVREGDRTWISLLHA